MKFAHIADVHLGAWRDQRLKQLPLKALTIAIDTCIQEQVEFLLIAGDIFNTALPDIGIIKDAIIQFKRLKEKNIPIYFIAGSHDYSPSGKSMLEVLEQTGIMTNVMKGRVKDNKLKLNFTQHNNVSITGILGKANMLDEQYYKHLDLPSLEQAPGDKIFMFHTAIAELMPNAFVAMHSMPLSLLPKNCKYYAGGHVHIQKIVEEPGYGTICYPGPLFPASFSELRDLDQGGMVIVDNWKAKHIPINLYPTKHVTIKVDNKTPQQIRDACKLFNIKDHIVTLKLQGRLDFALKEIQLPDIIQDYYTQGAYVVLKNTAGITTKEFESVYAQAEKDQVEKKVIQEHMEQSPLPFTQQQISQLIQSLATPRAEGETVQDYQQRMAESISLNPKDS